MAGSRRNALIGAAGEFYVAAQLSERGWYTTMTIKDFPEFDILAHHPDTTVTITLQSKATRGNQSWVLSGQEPLFE